MRPLRVLVIAVCGALSVPALARAQSTPERLVTFVARQCPAYTDIAANRARNDIQESLEDLGVDSAYTGGVAVSPEIENQQNPNCRPLPGWSFKLGNGYLTRADVGPWGSLSKVTGPFDTPTIVTKDSVPLLDRNGDPTGTTIAGAVTVALTAQQAVLAATPNTLWAEGGLPGDPVLDLQYPGAFGFGALRCALDSLNGDNVEYVSYPAGARHVFCYAYYVTPPPTSGTIVVRKDLDVPAGSAPQTFTYRGNISYTSDHTFSLTAGPGQAGSETFYRAGGQTWSFTEDDLPGYARTNLTCASATGASATTTDVATGAASVALAAGDTVTCTYTNAIAPPPPAALVIAKRTFGATGTFGFGVSGPEARSLSLTTTDDQGVAAVADPLTLQPGHYTVAEDLPAETAAGRWSLDAVECDGIQPRLREEAAAVDIAPGAGAACVFTNRFTPAGSIVVRKRTDGGTGRAGFVIAPLSRVAAASYALTATTTQPGVPVRATGDDTSALPLGTYDIVETGPTTVGGAWTLESVVCDGRPVGAAQGRARVTLTSDHPAVDCTFINRFARGPEPANPQPETPTPGGGVQGQAAASRPRADLHITKSVSPRVARPGQRIVYRIVVTNRGPDTAYDVVGTEIGLTVRKPVRIHVTRGSCRAVRPVRCHLSSLAAGRRVVLTAVTTAPRKLGPSPNRVAVVTSTSETRLSDNEAKATVVVRRAPRPPAVTG
ncbi:MAG TPA: DUF11 domain-containing protein [Baekduia sp.]|uniref:DUF11 domain-containing protein n=1 Tax=Baekduia sp. TaxID=2600305 RepID=UPI002D77B579|nr:DUF11 domain-containing protein [Baekduia sp.]HET6506971.1 DUF11 domain-containing protein [Baekduia sp.]